MNGMFSFLFFVLIFIAVLILLQPCDNNRLLFIIKHFSTMVMLDTHQQQNKQDKSIVLKELISKFIENI